MTVEFRHKVTGKQRLEYNVVSIEDDGKYYKIKKDASKSIICGVAIDKQYVTLVKVKE